MLRIVYMGTPEFSVAPLKAILDENKYQVVGVVTNLDKPFGRKQILTPPRLKVFALENNIPVYQYRKIREEGVEDLRKLNADLFITCAFGQILSQEIIDIPKLGVINIHASILPKYRGASPINYAILNGEKQTGITIMKTDIGIDTGDIILCDKLEILDNENTESLSIRLSNLGAKSILKVLDLIENDKVCYVKQNENNASYTKMIKKEDALIDWNKNNFEILNRINAFNPAPICYTFLNGEMFKIYSAELNDTKLSIGEIKIENNQMLVGCYNGSVSIKNIQRSGGKMLEIKDFLRGFKLNSGDKFS